jgi:hypothetical protein
MMDALEVIESGGVPEVEHRHLMRRTGGYTPEMGAGLINVAIGKVHQMLTVVADIGSVHLEQEVDRLRARRSFGCVLNLPRPVVLGPLISDASKTDQGSAIPGRRDLRKVFSFAQWNAATGDRGVGHHPQRRANCSCD